jgi:hypothetical protein
MAPKLIDVRIQYAAASQSGSYVIGLGGPDLEIADVGVRTAKYMTT